MAEPGAETPDLPKPESAVDDVKSVGRGALYLTFTKFWFLVSGYVIVFGLPRLLGAGDLGKALYGKYSVVTGFGSILNAFVIQGTTQAVARFVGRNPGQGDGVRRAAYRLQALIGGTIFLTLWVGAPVFAVHVYNDPDLIAPLRCVGFINLAYAFYAVSAGFLNGTKRFSRQALADFCFSTLKVVGVLGFAWLLKDQLGALVAPVAGFAAAATCVMLLAWFLAGRATGPGYLGIGTLFVFQVLTMLFMLVSTFVVQGNLQLLKSVLKDAATIDHMAADFAAAQQFATIPYQAVIAITFVLFPLVTAAGSDHEKMRGYVRQTIRYAAIIACAIVSLFVACPERTIHVLFPANYAPAAGPLPLLAIGYLCFALAYVTCSILTASGRAVLSLLVMLTMAVVQVSLSLVLIESHGVMGVATASSVGMAAGLALGHVFLRAKFAAGLPVLDLMRVLAAGAIAGLFAHWLGAERTFWEGSGMLAQIAPTSLKGKGVTIVIFGAAGTLYLAALFLFGALHAEDRKRLMKVIRR